MSTNERISEALQKRIAANKQRLADAQQAAVRPNASAASIWLAEAKVVPADGDGE